MTTVTLIVPGLDLELAQKQLEALRTVLHLNGGLQGTEIDPMGLVDALSDALHEAQPREYDPVSLDGLPDLVEVYRTLSRNVISLEKEKEQLGREKPYEWTFESEEEWATYQAEVEAHRYKEAALELRLRKAREGYIKARDTLRESIPAKEKWFRAGDLGVAKRWNDYGGGYELVFTDWQEEMPRIRGQYYGG